MWSSWRGLDVIRSLFIGIMGIHVGGGLVLVICIAELMYKCVYDLAWNILFDV